MIEADRVLIAKAAYADPVFFCKTFLHHWFPGRVPWVHRGILAILTGRVDFLLQYGELDKIEKNFIYAENPSDPNSKMLSIFKVDWEDGKAVKVTMHLGPYTLLMLPRGLAKTTLNNAVLLYDIVYMDCKFPVYISETGTHARMQLGNVKRELESNALMIEVFGNKVPGRQDSEKWTEDMITTTDGITVVAKGRGAQIRGLNYNSNRPDRMMFDDLEDKESVATSEQREKTRDWFLSDALPALSRMEPNASVVCLGTLLHPDALLFRLLSDPKFTAVRFGALDVDGEPLWPENLGHEVLEQTKDSFARAGRLSSFYLEYMSLVRDEETSYFRQDMFQYLDPLGELEYAAKAVVIDPAISNAATADDCVIAVVGITTKGKIGVIDIWGKRGASPREQVDMYFNMVAMHMPDRHGVEAIAYQAALVHLLREEMFRRKMYFEIEEIKHKTRKQERILGVLQPRYAARYVFHARPFPKLEQQLLDFNGKNHDDYPDAVAMAVSLLDPYAAQAADPDIDLAKDEYKSLEDELDGTYYSAP